MLAPSSFPLASPFDGHTEFLLGIGLQNLEPIKMFMFLSNYC
jgi:hypothetical protein